MRRTLFNIFCLFWILFFAYLGYWQIGRLHWKNNLIAQVSKYENSPPVLFYVNSYDARADLFKKVKLEGHFLHENEILLSAKYKTSEREKTELGYHIITPFKLDSGDIVFINRGWVPEEYKTRESRPESLYKGNVIEGILRENWGKAPWFMPQNMPEKDLWFWIDMPQMVKRLEGKTGLHNIKPVLIQQTSLTTENNFKYPEPISGHLEFYNQHLTYIITWFSMSFVMLIMWLLHNRKVKTKS